MRSSEMPRLHSVGSTSVHGSWLGGGMSWLGNLRQGAQNAAPGADGEGVQPNLLPSIRRRVSDGDDWARVEEVAERETSEARPEDGAPQACHFCISAP